MLLCLIGDWALIYSSVSKGITVSPRWKPYLGRWERRENIPVSMSISVWMISLCELNVIWCVLCSRDFLQLVLGLLLPWFPHLKHSKSIAQSLIVIPFNPFSFAALIFTVFILQVLHSFWRPISTHFGTCMQIHAQGVFNMVLTNPDPEISQCRHQIAMHNLNAKLSTSYFIISTVYYSQANTILTIQLWQRA